jgi:aminoglycoside 6'-N-acetyltransferase
MVGVLELRPLRGEDEPVLAAITEDHSVGRWGWSTPGDEEATRLAILVDGEIAGLVQYFEEDDPDYRHASIDVFLGPAHQGRGLGTEAVRRVVDLLLGERGHHRITIDPAADNHAAIRSYEKVGFRRVGVMEAAWRDPDGHWRDGLLMELVRRPPSPGTAAHQTEASGAQGA